MRSGRFCGNDAVSASTATGSGVSGPDVRPALFQSSRTRSLPALRGPAFDVRLDRKIACGAHASVVEGTRCGRRVAVKVLPVEDAHSAAELRGFSILGAAHANIVSAMPALPSPDGKSTYLPLELCDGDLLTHADAKGGLDELEAGCMFLQLVRAVRFSHSRGVYHLDIKPENVLLKGLVPKLGDFGSCAVRPASEIAAGAATGAPRFLTTRQCGTLIYACPEAIITRQLQKLAEGGEAAAGSPTQAAKAARRPTTAAPLPKPVPTIPSLRPHSRGAVSRPGSRHGLGAAARSPATAMRSPVAVSAFAFPDVDEECTTVVGFDAEKADVWAIGVTMFVLVTGFFPWKAAIDTDKRYASWCSEYDSGGASGSLAKLYRAVFGRAVSQKGSPLSREFMDVLWRCLNPDSARRLTMKQLETHPFFRTASLVMQL